MLADMGWNLKNTEEWDEAFRYARKAIRLNPVHPAWYLETPIFVLLQKSGLQTVLQVAKTVFLS